MKGGEQDELRRAEVEAQRQAAGALRRIERLVEPAREHPVAPRWRRPTFRSLFTVIVPDSHVLIAADRAGEPCRIVLCRCGAQTLLPPKGHVECAGVRWQGDVLDPAGCPRFFRPDRRDVRVHNFRP